MFSNFWGLKLFERFISATDKLHEYINPSRSISENIRLIRTVIGNVLKYKGHVENNELNETSTGQLAGSHLCMNQYRSMFRKYRRAEKKSDVQIDRQSVLN